MLATFSIIPSPKVCHRSPKRVWSGLNSSFIRSRKPSSSHTTPFSQLINLSKIAISRSALITKHCKSRVISSFNTAPTWACMHTDTILPQRRSRSNSPISPLWIRCVHYFYERVNVRSLTMHGWIGLQLIAQVMCGVSTSLRFPGQLNG